MGKFLTDLADVLRASGVKVSEVSGWKTRGFKGQGLASLRGIVIHHTATPWTTANEKSNTPTLDVIKNGRAGLPGPLAQLYVARDGTWYVVAAGHANHVGTAAVGETNSVSLGIEVEASGTGDKRDWPRVQSDSLIKGTSGLDKHYGVAFVKGHKEVALPKGRKVDPNFDMDNFRAKLGLVTSVTPGRNYTSRSTKDIQELVGADPDGFYGLDTTVKVMAWQGKHGLGVDGLWGPKSDAVGFPRITLTNGVTAENHTPIAVKPATGASKRVLKRGVSGDDVKRLQQALKILVKAQIPVTGHFLGLTDWWLRKFQQKYKLTVDGVCGPNTYAKLAELGYPI